MLSTRNNGDPLNGRFDHLDRSGRSLAALMRQPLWPVLIMVIATVLLAWWFLLSMAGALAGIKGTAQPLGPGMTLIARYLSVEPGSFAATLADLCLSADTGALLTGGGNPGVFVALALMWLAMAAAMMLPTAAPMIRTYAEIADTAAARGDAVVHPMVLTAGYVVLWMIAAMGFAALQMLIGAVTGSGTVSPVRGAIAGVVLVCAGAYQFSSFKHACLNKCRNPFTTLFARWQTRTAGVFRLGVEQGLWCLGCCWALMLMMLAVGSMNVIWMAALTLFTFVEKTGSGRVTSRIGGAIVALWGVALLWGAAT